MAPTIERSRGVAAGPYTAGAGYSGATPELDSVVAAAAVLLAEHYGRDVEIRFNTDRQSGGAYVRGVATLGITAKLWNLERCRQWAADDGESVDRFLWARG